MTATLVYRLIKAAAPGNRFQTTKYKGVNER